MTKPQTLKLPKIIPRTVVGFLFDWRPIQQIVEYHTPNDKHDPNRQLILFGSSRNLRLCLLALHQEKIDLDLGMIKVIQTNDGGIFSFILNNQELRVDNKFLYPPRIGPIPAMTNIVFRRTKPGDLVKIIGDTRLYTTSEDKESAAYRLAEELKELRRVPVIEEN